ncbi:UNKNOWN [Stylonychia lemnae]|uniref:Uncharacterized protein n=1 Tax=Stylonychia lemnae TaxID=5949 RepID=A0A078A1Q1_STYLE|nr:UNKNOWN [Stylonychia lemnae]|eukprot:CDW74709.1 UNKNOWN [Stylonychia lemnae]
MPYQCIQDAEQGLINSLAYQNNYKLKIRGISIHLLELRLKKTAETDDNQLELEEQLSARQKDKKSGNLNKGEYNKVNDSIEDLENTQNSRDNSNGSGSGNNNNNNIYRF